MALAPALSRWQRENDGYGSYMTLVGVLITLLKIAVVFNAVMAVVTLLVWVERRVSAFIQDRLGPNRVGPYGLLQPLADAIKFIFKEDLIPGQVNRPVFIIAPALSLIPALITFAVIPFGGTLRIFGWEIPLIITDVNIGVLYIFALSSLGVYGIVLAGWASNNKYSLIGGLRSSAQMISYELALSLSIIGVLLLTGSLSLREIVYAQYGLWNVVKQPLAFFIFLVAVFAETNRLPFDLPEAETELVAGYHTEYAGMKFAMFFMAEYANMVTASALVITVFFGGWMIPFVSTPEPSSLWLSILEILAFVVKVSLVLFLFVWVRWTLPRFRYDQLMMLGWKVLLPLALFNIIVTAGIVALT